MTPIGAYDRGLKCYGFQTPLHALLTFIRGHFLEVITVSDSTTAEIIPFPARFVAPVPTARRTAEDERLGRALANLNEALITQRAAMAGWKASLIELRAVTGRLGASLRRYNDSMAQLDTKVGTLRAEAKKLEYWADTALAKSS